MKKIAALILGLCMAVCFCACGADEAEFYASIGADTVGMSTACETIALRHMGVKVLCINCVTNYCPNVVSNSTSHDEVQKNADKVSGKMVKFVKRIVKKIGE